MRKSLALLLGAAVLGLGSSGVSVATAAPATEAVLFRAVGQLTHQLAVARGTIAAQKRRLDHLAIRSRQLTATQEALSQAQSSVSAGEASIAALRLQASTDAATISGHQLDASFLTSLRGQHDTDSAIIIGLNASLANTQSALAGSAYTQILAMSAGQAFALLPAIAAKAGGQYSTDLFTSSNWSSRSFTWCGFC